LPDHRATTPPAATLTGLLARAVDQFPEATVLESDAGSLSYGAVADRVARVAATLQERGVRRGDRVGLLLENGPQYVAGFFGILRCGACCVALNSANKPHTNGHLLADSGAVALLTGHEAAGPQLAALVREASGLHTVVTDADAHQDLARPGLTVLDWDHRASAAASLAAALPPPPRPDDLAAILYTSGSTGHPRGVTLTHRNLVANTRQILAYLELTHEDSVLCVLPFHYSFGNSLLLTHVAVGGRVVVNNRFAYPAAVVDHLQRSRVTGFSGVPSTYAILAARTDFLQRRWPDLRYLTQAGGAMSPALQRRLRESLPAHVRLFVMYGQTEASARLSYVPPERLPQKYGSIGIAIPGVDLSIRHPDGSACAPGQVGELVARGENIMQGYWNDPDATREVLHDGALHTGDLGREDADGFIWLVDRIKNLIKVGANRVSAKEVEEAIAEVAGVQEVCVVGVADEMLGEAIEAHVVPAPDAGPTAATILRHCRERLALFKVPRAIHFRDGLPRNSSGKILRNELGQGR
jgi:acyl-CoA synthetase (AMP-forming)/AMP-acid ligase II